jgi:hypothetical protein
MRNVFASALLIAVSGALSSAVGASAAADRPVGVAASQWLPVSSSVGIVLLSHGDAPHPNSPFGVAAPAEGYFMVKVGDSWRRLAIANPGRPIG